MEGYIQFIYNAWKKFVETGDVEPGVRPEIAESWKRCRSVGVDYTNGRGNDRYKIPVELKIEQDEELISVTRPIMEGIYNIVKGSGFAIILCNKEGYLIDVIGDGEVMQKADELNFVKGALWTEEAVGTNAIGTALFLDKPIQTMGAEHYGISQHSWTCSAAPIHDEEGKIIGCINMSGNYHDAHSHTLAIVTAAAQSIQKQLALMVSSKLMNITFDSISEGMIVTDENLKIKRVNDRAASILSMTKETMLRMNIEEVLKNVNFSDLIDKNSKAFNNLECDLQVKNNRIKCVASVVPMKSNNRLMGVVITFSETKNVHKLVNKVVGYQASYNFDDIITKDGKMKSIIQLAKKAARSECNILIEGKSGTGKELIAQSIHNYSSRSEGPFVAVNCASIPRELVESELFGYDRGAFTGAAREGHPGKFELADGGTIFLDEIGELPLDIQSKLLRVLDNNKIVRVGGTYEKALDVRIIGATNRTLKEEIKRKSFREDLYYRLNVINIKTIPLVERKDDIEELAKYFVEKLNSKNFTAKKVMTKAYIKQLMRYDWPGNVRELRNVVEKDYYLCEGNLISAGCFNEEASTGLDNKDEPAVIPMEVLEKNSIKNALKACEGNIVKAARLLNISRATMYRKIKKHSINNER